MPPVAPLALLSALGTLFASSLAASVGTVGDLTVSNKDIAPDGYTRAAVVVNGQFPGPLIVGNKVSSFLALGLCRSKLTRREHL